MTCVKDFLVMRSRRTPIMSILQYLHGKLRSCTSRHEVTFSSPILEGWAGVGEMGSWGVGPKGGR